MITAPWRGRVINCSLRASVPISITVGSLRRNSVIIERAAGKHERDKRSMDEAAQKGLVTRQRRWEARNEKRRQKALEEEAKAARIKAEDEKYMKEAIKQAKKAAKIGDVPIGCVLVKDGEIIARGYNRRNADKTVLSHAEVTSIKRACKKEGDWRLEDCTLYVTLEPCPMCAGAIVQARIPRVVIGSMNSKAGCAGSVLNLLKEPGFNHQAQVVTGILEEECSEMMSSFFTELRKKKRLPETP